MRKNRSPALHARILSGMLLAGLACVWGCGAARRPPAPEGARGATGPADASVSLDAGAIDVVTQMPNVYSFLKMRYREAFGTTQAEWIAASPFHVLDRTAAPWLGVCSTKRKDDPCAQARAYADKSNGLGVHAAALPERMSHRAINAELGEQGEYTDGVESFMATLDPTVAALLK